MLLRKLITEALGTFFLVLTIGITAQLSLPTAPVAIGGILAVMVYMGGAISGAHYNPAVTFAVYLRGKIPAGEALRYAAAQIVGSTAAALTVYAILFHDAFLPAPNRSASVFLVIAVEALFTFALALVVLNVATTRESEGNSYFGAAIGGTVMVGAFTVGPISGAVFNPAVAIGPGLVTLLLGDGDSTQVIYYIVGPLIGAALAAGVFRLQHPRGEPAPAEDVGLAFPRGLSTE